MLELKDGFVFYHGSYCEVKEPDLAKCAKRKDFGQGFYLTTSKEQAESFLRTSIAKAIATGTIEEGQKFGYISTFEFNLSGNLETHIFENADVDWLHCIAAHRKKKMFIEVEREMEIKLGGGFLGMFGGENHIDQWDEFHCFPVISGLDNIFR